MRATRLLVPTLIFLIGAALGYVGCWYYFHKTVRQATSVARETLESALYTYEFNEAERQFNNTNHDVAIYALERAVRHLDSFQEPRYVTCRRTAYNLGKYNIRLATLYEEKGNQQARKAYLEKAMASYETMGWKLKDIDELQKAIPFIESDRTPEALKTYGVLITPCDMK